MIVIPRSLVRVQLARCVKIRTRKMVGWPSGLRRQVKALISSEARVQIPSQPFGVFVCDTHTHTHTHTHTRPWRNWQRVGFQTRRLGVQIPLASRTHTKAGDAHSGAVFAGGGATENEKGCSARAVPKWSPTSVLGTPNGA